MTYGQYTPQEYNAIIGAFVLDQIVAQKGHLYDAQCDHEQRMQEFEHHRQTDCVAAPGRLCPVCEPL